VTKLRINCKLVRINNVLVSIQLLWKLKHKYANVIERSNKIYFKGIKMRNMKKYISFIFGLILIFTLIGCTSTPGNTVLTLSNKRVEDNSNITKVTYKQKENTQAVSNEIKDSDGNLKVHYINVGQADSILIQQGSTAMLIDAGNNEDSEIVKSYIANQGITKLDYVIGTHPHEDHLGGLDYVINSFQIGKIYLPKASSTTKTFEDVVNAIKNKGMKATNPTPGESFKLGQATCTVLAPNGSGYKDANNNSIVIKVTFGSNSFLFTGDAEEVSEKEMLAKGYDLKADVLKIGHHGSYSSTSQEFLNKVSPKYAVVSVGVDNSYGHPNKESMDRLKAKDIPTYRTDQSGTIIATSDGKDITFNAKPGSYSNGTDADNSGSNISSNTVVTKSTKETNTNTSINRNNKTVYFTPNGKSYHYDKNCSTLKRSKTILEGTQQEALGLAHSDPCNVCAGGN